MPTSTKKSKKVLRVKAHDLIEVKDAETAEKINALAERQEIGSGAELLDYLFLNLFERVKNSPLRITKVEKAPDNLTNVVRNLDWSKAYITTLESE